MRQGAGGKACQLFTRQAGSAAVGGSHRHRGGGGGGGGGRGLENEGQTGPRLRIKRSGQI